MTKASEPLPLIKQRLWHNLRQPVCDWVRRQSTVFRLALEHGYTMRILNDGQHWEFKRDGMLLEWWPSTGTTMTNKRADLSCIHTFNGLRLALTKMTP